MQGNYEILIKKLNKFIREYYKNLIMRGVIYSLIGMFSVLIVFALVEHFGFFNSLTRTILFWMYCLIALTIVVKFVVLPTIKMLRLTESLTHEEAAKIIGAHFTEVSDKLINILEFIAFLLLR